MRKQQGFTLAELLIALAILGVIATFSIPKVLNTQQEGKFKVIAKESAGMVSEAFQAYLMSNSLTEDTHAQDLKGYINYVSRDTTSNIDGAYGNGSVSCTGTNVCLRLHNGAVILIPDISFGGTATTNAVYFYVDPDGQDGGVPNGTGNSVVFFLYANGRLTTWKNKLANTTTSFGVEADCASCDPPWFSWN
ncbi:MAG TPA: type II secretion system protein [Oculatellaceae cyanobacterium]